MAKKQKTAAHARKSAWSPEARAKRAATRAAKLARLEQHRDFSQYLSRSFAFAICTKHGQRESSQRIANAVLFSEQ